MNCPKCKKIIVGNANYCSYCGEKVNTVIVNKEYDKDDLLLKSYIKEGLYSNILDMALAGNVTAEYVIISMIVKYAWNVDEKNYLKLEQQKDNPTAVAISGICEIWNTVKKQEGNVAEKFSRGFDLIESAAEDGDPAALYFLGTFYLGKTASRYERNEMKAYRYIKKAVDKRFPSAIYDLGSWYYRGENGVNKDEVLGESMLMTGIHYQSFLEEKGNLSETDLSKMLKNEIVTKAKEILKTDAKKIPNVEKKKEDFVPGTSEEIQLWNEFYACETQNALEKIKKKIDREGYTGVDRRTAIKWIESCMSLYEQRQKAEEEKKRKEEEAERERRSLEEKKKQMEEKKKKQEEERKIRESAENVIDSCKNLNDYLYAIDKLRALNLSKSFFDEYEKLLTEKIKEHYALDIAAVKNCAESEKKMDEGYKNLKLTWIIGMGLLVVSFFLFIHGSDFFFYLCGAILIYCLFFTYYTYSSDGYNINQYSEEYRRGIAAKSFLKKFEEKGYDIYK